LLTVAPAFVLISAEPQKMMLCRSDDVSPLPIGWALGIYLSRAVEYPVFVHRSHAGSTI